MQNIEYLKTHIIERVNSSHDEELLDLILGLLISADGALSATA